MFENTGKCVWSFKSNALYVLISYRRTVASIASVTNQLILNWIIFAICFHPFSLCLSSACCVINVFYWMLCKYNWVRYTVNMTHFFASTMSNLLKGNNKKNKFRKLVWLLLIYTKFEHNLNIQFPYCMIKAELIPEVWIESAELVGWCGSANSIQCIRYTIDTQTGFIL